MPVHDDDISQDLGSGLTAGIKMEHGLAASSGVNIRFFVSGVKFYWVGVWDNL